MIHTAVIADDITGANDIGIMYYKAGLSSTVYSFELLEQTRISQDRDTVIIDTNSRFLTQNEAYDRVYTAAGYFKNTGVRQYYNKQCSVFRGNIGAEFDALLDALDENFAVVVLGFPDNGRTTRHGCHYVYGTLLENSQFAKDPVHPMKCSDLVQILSAQTSRKVSAVFYEILDMGVDALKQELLRLRRSFSYCIIDVRDNHDLELIAKAVENERVICGSSAIGYYLGLLWKETDMPAAGTATDTVLATTGSASPILCIAGSLTKQTKAQTQYMKARGYPVLCLDTTRLFDAGAAGAEGQRIMAECRHAFKTGCPMVMIHAMQEEAQVARTKALGKERGLDNTQVSELVSQTLSGLAECIATEHKINRFIICGGDTSAAFCRQFSIAAMDIGPEIESGVPICMHNAAPFQKLVLKSGSFGSDAFIEKALTAFNHF